MDQVMTFKYIFPSKRVINKILFQLDTPLTSKYLLPLYEDVFLGRRPSRKVSGDVYYMMSEVLRKVKDRNRYEPMELAKLRKDLLFLSSLNGCNDGIAKLCYDIIKEDNESTDNKTKSKDLLLQLVKHGHLLSFKLVGDIYFYKTQEFDEAKRWYSKFVENYKDRIFDNEVLGNAAENLGIISFHDGDFELAERIFLKVIKMVPKAQCVRSIFYLSQIYIKYDPLKSKILLESCCSEGFKESFKEIGYLEMRYFENFERAMDWFKIGMESFDIECFFGYFDCSYRLQKFEQASHCYKSMLKLSNASTNYKNLFDLFVNNRRSEIKQLMTM
ncbi:hypothetical protein KAFR_0A06780 [Kazachstania africana CBS 2517]|uniref:Uncharacterized protein n=1 Tax=Kazachstania africana (strain ATCC 22294 / BCRC 22015 / CBS 2517 / CECT 1963 / NBRC 1671 / NRRL Y-8276) TaxID=1071382 RepID=H2AP13_KAZAF|nr:hypothetical protein KAFR_0A06780 [Kazachstania africana CBS 2517]CCF56113.1 hypothetical protein KAFR_0A06780 [Kazachstania africana CBS 2517]